MIIETSPLNTIHSIGPEGAVADAGVLWKDLLQATFPQGLRPVTTGYLGLSIGGTVSVGGCPLSNHQGALVDNVQEMTVVTGRGDVLSCSDTQHKDLFEVVLAGLGQCGIITQAKVNLLPALPMARTYLLNYLDNATFFRDFRTLAQRGELNEVYNLCFPPGSNTFVYQINATIFFDPANPPNDDYLLRGLSLPPAAAVKQDQNYVDYALFVDKQIEILKTAGWESLIKPWFDVWLADSVVEGYVGEVLASLTEFDVGPTGFMLIFAQKRAQMTRPFFRIPEGEEWVYLFDILTASALPGPNPVYIDQMLARNRRLFEQARGLGGTRYPIGALPFAKEDWMIQYGYVWPEFVRRKKKFDPDNILTPGPGIF